MDCVWYASVAPCARWAREWSDPALGKMVATTAEPLPLPRRLGVALAACAFVSAIAWQVATQRDDWPLSCFAMYSKRQGPTASRSFVRGVSDQGEFELADDMLPVGGARLRHLNEKLHRNEKRRARFAAQIQQRYEARRKPNGWPALQAVRAYKETWKIRGGLEGIDRPKRRLVASMYLPPPTLVERLALERASEAPVAAPRRAPEGDVVVELAARACVTGCEAFGDRYAAANEALRLTAREDAAMVSVPLDLEPGEYSLLVRMRTPKGKDRGRLRPVVDGHLLREKPWVGDYESALGRGAWVWASASPGSKALRLDTTEGRLHDLRLELPHGAVELDQVWLSRAQRELPTWNEPVAP